MADPLSIVGVVYPIARDLLILAGKMKIAYKGIRYAKKDLGKVIERTKTVAKTYEFFSDTMKYAKKIPELAPMFKRHRKLIGKVKTESKRIISKLKRIKDIFGPLINGENVNWADKYIAHYEWFLENKKAVPYLFQRMKVLEKSMRTIGILVDIHMLYQVYQKDKSNPILVQLKSMRKILDIEFNKLQHAQHRMSPDQVLNPNVFAQEVLQILEKEIPRLQMNNPPDSPPTSHSGPSTTSSVLDQPSPITPPSTSSHHSGGNKAFVVEPQSEEIQISRRKVLRRRRRTKSEPPQNISSLSPSPSFLSSVAEVENQSEENPKNGSQGQYEDREKEGVYMPMPPFGPPKLAPRPLARRRSPDHSNPPGGRHG